MIRNAVAFYSVASLALAALGLAREPGCGGTDSPSSGLNAPCTRSKDCSEGLACTGGVCTDPDAAVVAPSDGGADAVPTDAGNDGS